MTVLALAFLVLWAVQRRRRHVLVLGLCYICAALGFALQSFDFGLGLTVERFLANALFIASLGMLTAAAIARQDVAVPYGPLGTVAAITLVVFSWFLLVDVEFVMRVFAMNFGLGAMCLIAAVRLRRSRRTALIDRGMVWLSLLGVVDFTARPIIMAMIGFGGDPLEHPLESPYWLATNLSAVVFCLLIALTLLWAVAVDAMRELTAESRTDPLSGLFNRRGFKEAAAIHFVEPDEETPPLSLVVADLDHFKQVNDLHGHAAGDRLIAGFSRLVAQATGRGAVAARTGGEEFAILLPGFDLAAARQFAEGLRAAVSSLRTDGATGVIHDLTCSFGVTTRSSDEDLAALMQRADEALLQAKRMGRNCVRVTYERPLPPRANAVAQVATG